MQNFEEFTASFEQGVVEGDRLLKLLAQLNPEITASINEFVPAEKLQPIFDYFVKRSQRYRYPYLEGFFSRTIKPVELQTDIITLWGADKFIANQSDYAPACNFPDEFQLVQFGYWCGDYCDGDGWCIDFDSQEITCVIVSAGDASVEEVRRCSYGIFPAFDFMTSFLRTSAFRRGWITEK